MRIAALALGVLGAAAGFIDAVYVVFIGGFGASLGAEGGEQVFAQGLGAVGASVAGLVGAVLAMPKPKASAIVMGLSAIAGVIFVTAAFIPGAILLLLAALFAFLGRKRG